MRSLVLTRPPPIASEFVTFALFGNIVPGLNLRVASPRVGAYRVRGHGDEPLFGVVADRTQDTRHRHAWAEPAAMWLVNLGPVVSFMLRIVIDTRFGALVVGIGVLLGVGTMMYRLLATPTDDS